MRATVDSAAAFCNSESKLLNRLQRAFAGRATRLRVEKPALLRRTYSLNLCQRFSNALGHARVRHPSESGDKRFCPPPP